MLNPIDTDLLTSETTGPEFTFQQLVNQYLSNYTSRTEVCVFAAFASRKFQEVAHREIELRMKEKIAELNKENIDFNISRASADEHLYIIFTIWPTEFIDLDFYCMSSGLNCRVTLYEYQDDSII